MNQPEPIDATPLTDAVTDAVATQSSYILHLLKDKPFTFVLSTLFSQVANLVTAGLPQHIVNLGALSLLVLIDFYTKGMACRKKGEPFTSKLMREKGFPKLRDYFIFYAAGSLTVPLMGEPWGYRTALFMMSFWELWSIAENLYDAGSIPYDIRQVPIFKTMAENYLPKRKTDASAPAPANTDGATPKEDTSSEGG